MNRAKDLNERYATVMADALDLFNEWWDEQDEDAAYADAAEMLDAFLEESGLYDGIANIALNIPMREEDGDIMWDYDALAIDWHKYKAVWL